MGVMFLVYIYFSAYFWSSLRFYSNWDLRNLSDCWLDYFFLTSHLLASVFFRLRSGAGKKHRYLLAVFLVSFSKSIQQIMLFQLQGYQDITGRGDGKQQVSHCHVGNSPESEKETQHHGMAHVLVQIRRLEFWRPQLAILHKITDLGQSEQVSVAYQEGNINHQCPAKS